MPRYELDGDVWQIVHAGKQLEITTGGKTAVRTFVTVEQALAQHAKLVGERVAAGYRLALHDPRHPDLEGAIAADPELPASYSVYGDWLESLGDPRGRLIAIQLAAEASTSAPTKLAATFAKELAKHADYLLGPLAALDQRTNGEEVFGWRFGFVHRAYLHAERQHPLDEALERLLLHPSGRFLVELSLVVDRMQGALDVLARLAPISLRALRLTAVWDLDLGALWAAMPRLRKLSLTGRGLALGTLDLPQLERLELVDSEMSNANATMLAAAPWPALQQLKLDFGHGYTTGDASIDDVFELLHRTDLVKLTKLSLLHTRYPGELVRELAASSLAKQLELLDLSNNQLTDAHVLELVGYRDRFPRLTQLDVSGNRLTPQALAALAGFPNLRARNQEPT